MWRIDIPKKMENFGEVLILKVTIDAFLPSKKYV